MKIKKTTYNPIKNITRENLSNPYSNESIRERLVNSKAIDMCNNSNWIDLKNGYHKTQIINKSKFLK
jgi:hypothetical protein